MIGTRRNEGFSLIEVLASLMIFSFAIVGLARTGTMSARSVSVLEEKTWAGIVADNHLVLARQQQTVPVKRSGEDEVMGQHFSWDLERVATQSPGFYRLEVRVHRVGDTQVLIRRTAFSAGHL